MGSQSGAVGIGVDDGYCTICWEILWPKVRILEYVLDSLQNAYRILIREIGWAKYMTWMYPVEVKITNKAAFNAAGAVEAAATL